MDRLDEIIRYIEPFRNKWISDKARMCKKRDESNLAALTKKVVSTVLKEQSQGASPQFCYLCLFHYKSSIWTGTYKYHICATDETMYFHLPYASNVWVPKQLYSDITELKQCTEHNLRKCFVRLQPYEIEYAVRAVIADYQKLAAVYWRKATELIVAGEEFKALDKRDDWKILAGNYMDNLNVILSA